MIASGEKTYELRRRPPPREAIGSVALIYSTAPEAIVTCACEVINIIAGPKESLWDEVGQQTGCSQSEYMDYFAGLEIASAIQLRLTENVFGNITRNELQTRYHFKPPQSWRWAVALKEIAEKL